MKLYVPYCSIPFSTLCYVSFFGYVIVDGLCWMSDFLDFCYTAVGVVSELPICFHSLLKTEYD